MKSAFVVIDVQGDWARSNPETTCAIKRSVNIARKSMDIIFVYMNWLGLCAPLRAEELSGSKYFNVFNKSVMQDDRDAPAILPERKDWILPKTSLSLFSNPYAETFLHEQGIGRLVFAGYQTTICFYHSARDAAYFGFQSEAAMDLTAVWDNRFASSDRQAALEKKRFTDAGIKLVNKTSLGL